MNWITPKMAAKKQMETFGKVGSVTKSILPSMRKT